jgi:hypothetical protein
VTATVVGPVGTEPHDPSALQAVGDGKYVAPSAPDAVERLAAAVSAFRAEQDAVAARQLAMPDLALDRVRGAVRSALEPVIEAFDAQADAASRPDPNLTERGRQALLDGIAANREKAVRAVVEPVEEALRAAEEKAQAQVLALSETATDDDRAAVADLGYQVTLLMPNHGTPDLTRFLEAAVEAKDVGKVAALRPLLLSLADRFPNAPGLDALVTQADAAAATWQQAVAQGRLARVQRLRWALGGVAGRALRYDPEGRASRSWHEFDVADYEAPGAPARPAPQPSEPPKPRKPRAVRTLRGKSK